MAAAAAAISRTYHHRASVFFAPPSSPAATTVNSPEFHHNTTARTHSTTTAPPSSPRLHQRATNLCSARSATHQQQQHLREASPQRVSHGSHRERTRTPPSPARPPRSLFRHRCTCSQRHLRPNAAAAVPPLLHHLRPCTTPSTPSLHQKRRGHHRFLTSPATTPENGSSRRQPRSQGRV